MNSTSGPVSTFRRLRHRAAVAVPRSNREFCHGRLAEHGSRQPHIDSTSEERMKLSKLNRDVHRWGSLVIALPLLVVIVSGILLQLKKDWLWVQPATQRGSTAELQLSFDQILAAVAAVPEAEVTGWDDVDRLDVRPAKGMVKVRCRNRWEVQVDASTGAILQTEYRRSDLIESLHDGSFFGDPMKLWVFLPSAIILAVLWLTGMYLFVLPYWARRKKKKRRLAQQAS
jgi:uncharacterized iron-regulated membrane protein